MTRRELMRSTALRGDDVPVSAPVWPDPVWVGVDPGGASWTSVGFGHGAPPQGWEFGSRTWITHPDGRTEEIGPYRAAVEDAHAWMMGLAARGGVGWL